MCMKEFVIVASRGRWDGKCWVQQYETNQEGVSNTLTHASKDNLVVEIYGVQDVSVSKRRE